MRYSGQITQDLLLKKGEKDLNPQESASELANTFYPNDDPTEDTTYHTAIRKWVDDKIGQICEPVEYTPITLDEIENVLKSISSKKMPGEDGLTADICHNAFHSAPLVLHSLINKCLEMGYFPRVRNEWYSRYSGNLEKQIIQHQSHTDPLAFCQSMVKYWKKYYARV